SRNSIERYRNYYQFFKDRLERLGVRPMTREKSPSRLPFVLPLLLCRRFTVKHLFQGCRRRRGSGSGAAPD
ncbi:MAG: hypothetical protein V4850_27655, partial [Myxococcota bacterium]